MLLTEAGLIDPNATPSPKFSALVSDSFGNSCRINLAFAQASQNSTFKSRSISTPSIEPLEIACLTAE
jgi:hypothetical protein